jgi:hypothetical protein
MVCIAVFFGGWRSLNKLKNETETIFYRGVSNDGYSIQGDLDTIIAQSFNLVTIAKNYINENDETIMDLLSARDILISALTPAEKYKANMKVSETAVILYDKLKSASGLTEIHKKLAAQDYTEILSRNSTIKNNGYNDAVRKYNLVIQDFPVSFIAPLVGVKPAELFG